MGRFQFHIQKIRLCPDWSIKSENPVQIFYQELIFFLSFNDGRELIKITDDHDGNSSERRFPFQTKL